MVAVTDYLVSYPAAPISIPQTLVDHVVQVASLGDPKKIVITSYSIHYTKLYDFLPSRSAKRRVPEGH